jgi:hypothetical protein
MYLRRLPVKAVVGLGAETVTALDSQRTLSTLLSGVDIVWARSDALSRLKAQRIDAAPFLPLGPALGLGMPGERGARVNGNEWTLAESQGRVLLTNKRPRATSFDAADSGVSGLVEASGSDFLVFPR